MRLCAVTLFLVALGIQFVNGTDVGAMFEKLKMQAGAALMHDALSTASNVMEQPAVAELASPVLFPIFQRPNPRVPTTRPTGGRSSSSAAIGIRGSTGRPASIANTSTGSVSDTIEVAVTPEQRANNTSNVTLPAGDALSKALMFTVCNTSATAFDQAYVNWIPGPAFSNTSFLQYQLCAAASLQPRLVSSFGLTNLQNSFGSTPFILRVDICGAQSEGKVPCAGRVTAEKPCLTGTARLPVAFDPAATRTTLSLGTLPPATTVVRMCL